MRSLRFLLTTAGLLAVAAAPLAAQATQGVRIPRSHVAGAAVAGPGVPVTRGGTFDFIAAGPAFGGQVVTNAPYSAEAVTETQQTLGDGNRISRTSSSKIVRDSQGRTRREQQIDALGPWSSAGEPTTMVFIDDPVAGVNYVLNTNERTAQKTTVHVERIVHKIEGGEPEKDVLKWTAAAAPAGQAGPMVFRRSHEVKQAGEGEQRDVTVVHSAISAARYFSEESAKTESLGKQLIEGVEAEGSRTTMTIPAGQIGNERPIEVVSESWYSPQLQTLVLSKHNDPRMGETTYRLTNIQLIEPLASMFEVPPDYTVQHTVHDGAMGFFKRELPHGDAESGDKQ